MGAVSSRDGGRIQAHSVNSKSVITFFFRVGTVRGVLGRGLGGVCEEGALGRVARWVAGPGEEMGRAWAGERGPTRLWGCPGKFDFNSPRVGGGSEVGPGWAAGRGWRTPVRRRLFRGRGGLGPNWEARGALGPRGQGSLQGLQQPWQRPTFSRRSHICLGRGQVPYQGQDPGAALGSCLHP